MPNSPKMDLARDVLMMCILCMMCVSSTLDLLFSRKPYGIRMCHHMISKYLGKHHVYIKYDEANLECVLVENHNESTQSGKIPLTSHGKQNVWVPIGTRRRSKGITRQKPQSRETLKTPQALSFSNRVVSNKVLSIAGSVAHNKRLYILLDTHTQDGSCTIEVFSFYNETYMKSAHEKPFRFKCLISEKIVYQMFIADHVKDILGLVTSGDVFKVRLYGGPVMLTFRALSAPLQWNEWNGPTFCFYCGEIVCLQKDASLKLDLHENQNSSAQRIPHHYKFTDITDVAYSAEGNNLIIVCKEQLILAKFYPSEDKVVVKDTIHTAMLTVTWLQSGLVFHPNGRLGNFKTCVSFSECNLLD